MQIPRHQHSPYQLIYLTPEIRFCRYHLNSRAKPNLATPNTVPNHPGKHRFFLYFLLAISAGANLLINPTLKQARFYSI